MQELVQCKCGHGITSHSGSGCDGERFRKCDCRRGGSDVIDAAIQEARTDYGRQHVSPASFDQA